MWCSEKLTGKKEIRIQVRMISLTIDGKSVSVPEKTTVLEAARGAGIDIPTLCFHKRLPPIGSCNMCIVQIKGRPEPVTSCNTAVESGMEIVTTSEALHSQRVVNLKKILKHHALDCPICDKAGECDLQNMVYRLGVTDVLFEPRKQKRDPAYATSLIRYWPERCILCRRCVTACHSIKGIGAIDIVGEGDDARVAPVAPDKCKSCGECMMVCPTGALTENLSRYKGRPWLEKRVKTTCGYCGCGCQLEISALDNRVIGVHTKTVDGVNQGSLCVKGRFGYEFIGDEARLKTPLIKEDGKFRKASWNEALDYTAKRLSAIKKQYGADSIAGLTSARCTNEENYLFQKFMRAVIGTNNVDHCARL
jgi:predicted molibdopterin-dependent oxidoreductase YjgC